MKQLSLIIPVLAFAVSTLHAANPPRGAVLELHSCELYAGGCTVSSQATLDGRYMLRAWNFSDGSFQGQTFAGLSVALVQSSSENLAADGTEARDAVVYLPNDATSSQQKALVNWLKANVSDLRSLRTRNVPLQFTKTAKGYSFAAGQFVSLSTAPLESCETGACGEALWYTPRTSTSVFTVAVNRSSHVSEPLLHLKWNDSSQRSVFVGKFGEQAPAANQFVTSADFCGPANQL